MEIKVFFETNSYCEQVAVFFDEETYATCLPALKRQATNNRFLRVTESICEDEKNVNR